jgi:hypothetical protein
MGFFDDNPRFLTTSKTGSTALRLNARYLPIIESNRAILEGKRVLDIASHDGRWSFAALKAGASHVTGIEARDYLVRNAGESFRLFDVPADRYSFLCGDVFEILAQQRIAVDTVLLLGFFYHTERHTEIARLIDRTGARHVILDTNILPAADNPMNIPLVKLFKEKTNHEANAFGEEEMAVVGHPSREAVSLIFSQHGFTATEFDWTPYRGSPNLKDYNEDRRTTFVLSR